MKLKDADRQALADSFSVRPTWTHDAPAGELVNLPKDCLLHAGPAFADRQKMTRPILNSACAAAVFEGLAPDLESARSRLENEQIKLLPAQDFGVVVPLAMVVSASMYLHEVVDAAADDSSAAVRAFAPLNGGSGPAARLGRYDTDVVHHLRWLNGPFADALRQVHHNPIDLTDIADQALFNGDDGHGRTIDGTAQLIEQFGSRLEAKSLEFLHLGPSFFLNLWMAACKCQAMSVAGSTGSSAIIAAGANGHAFGLKVAGLPDRWFTASAAAPVGDLGKWSETRALGAIGDSAIVDICGFGAMAMAHAPAQAEALGPYMPHDGLYRPAQLFAGRHPGFRRASIHSGLFARQVQALGKTPLISLGILDAQGEAGRLGGGIYETPMTPFKQAVAALDAAR